MFKNSCLYIKYLYRYGQGFLDIQHIQDIHLDVTRNLALTFARRIPDFLDFLLDKLTKSNN